MHGPMLAVRAVAGSVAHSVSVRGGGFRQGAYVRGAYVRSPFAMANFLV